MQMKEKAIELQDVIFSHQQAEFDKILVEFIDLLGSQKHIQLADPDFSALLQSLLLAYEQKDYLLFADLLEYKLQRLL